MDASIVSIKNKNRNIDPVIVGKGKRTAIAVNIGLSKELSNQRYIKIEIKKAMSAIEAGADILSDVSIAGPIKKLRERLLAECSVPIGTLPFYEACVDAIRKTGTILNCSEQDIVRIIEEHAREGVDIMTLHAAFTSELAALVTSSRRLIPIPSRGGALMAEYMFRHKTENPLYSRFDEILGILKANDVTLSIGSALRPGSIVDGLDNVFIGEMVVQGELVSRALSKGVKTIVEGIGHVPADQILLWIKLAKRLCHGVPVRPMPIATDVGAGHDHISGAIAGAIAAMYGADVLCCLTRTEHLGLPRVKDITEAIFTYKIAAHIADIVKLEDLVPDEKISEARRNRDWNTMFQYALDRDGSSELYKKLNKNILNRNYCSMCGQLCAHRTIEKYIRRS